MAITITHNADEAVKIQKWTVDYAATGRRVQVTFNGPRDELRQLARLIADNEGVMLSDLGRDYGSPSLEDDGAGIRCRTPRLINSATGDMCELIVFGEQGLKEGDTYVAENEDDVSDVNDANTIPPGVTCRVLWEPNDIPLLLAPAFHKWTDADGQERSGQWNLDVPFNDEGVTSEALAAFETYFNDSDTITDVIYNLRTLADENAKRTILNYLKTHASAKEYLKRLNRDQTHYRQWLPQVIVTRRYRTAPALPSSGAFAGSPTAPDYPPAWTGRKERDPVTNQTFTYYKGASHIEPAGDFWVTEEIWNGLLSADTEIYSAAYDNSV